jgi:hypothetical protein
MNNRHVSLLVASFTVVMFGCKATNAPGVSQGSLKADVVLMDSSGNDMPLPYRDITIGIEGTNFQATADSLGGVTFTNIPPGQYNVVASKPGFGLAKACAVLIEGPAQSYTRLALGTVPTSPVHLDSVTGSTAGIKFYASTTGGAVAYFIDLDSSVRPGDAHLYFLPIYPKGGRDGWIGNAEGEYLNRAGIFPGMKLYVSAATYNPHSYVYSEGADARYRLVSPGPKSNVISIVVQ